MKLARFFEKFDQFDQFADTPNALAKLRELILSLAVRGKLVSQDSNDKPVANKGGRNGESGTQTPFEIPEQWGWTRLSELADVNGGFAFKSAAYSEEGTRVVRISDFDEFGFKDHNIVRHPLTPELQRFTLSEGSTGGLRATNSLEIFPCPEPTGEKNYEVYFFCRGLRHLPVENQERARQLKSGERLYLMQDLQNSFDSMALLMRTADPITLVGYAPKYYSAEFTQLIKVTSPDQVKITVEQVNSDAPIQYRVLCKLVSPWPANFSPCTTKEFEALA